MPQRDATRSLGRLEGTFALGSAITLEEPPGVLTVSPRASLDHPHGGFLVRDIKEQQVRVYDERGRLGLHVGGKGTGDTTFRTPPTVSIRRPDGSLLVCEFSAVCTSVGPAGGVVRQLPVPELETIYDGVPIDGTSDVLLAGVQKGSDNLLHVWNPRTNSIGRSYFSLPSGASLRATARFAGHASVAVQKGRVAAVFAFDPTIYLFDLEGTPRGQIPLASKGFRRIERPAPLESGDREAISAWANTLSRASDVFWLSSDVLVVQYYDLVGLQLRWGLVGLSVNGQRLFEIAPSAKLMAVDPETGILWFIAPPGDAPNRWVQARLVPEAGQ